MEPRILFGRGIAESTKILLMDNLTLVAPLIQLGEIPHPNRCPSTRLRQLPPVGRHGTLAVDRAGPGVLGVSEASGLYLRILSLLISFIQLMSVPGLRGSHTLTFCNRNRGGSSCWHLRVTLTPERPSYHCIVHLRTQPVETSTYREAIAGPYRS